jgi:hypothetical protein
MASHIAPAEARGVSVYLAGEDGIMRLAGTMMTPELAEATAIAWNLAADLAKNGTAGFGEIVASEVERLGLCTHGDGCPVHPGIHAVHE